MGFRNKRPKVSVCITTFNETEERVNKLLDALSKQTLKPDEIIIVEATPNSKLQIPINKQYTNFKLQIIQKPNASRSEGRNVAIGKAKNEIVAITDVGCIPHVDWLEKITLQLRSGQVKPFDLTSSRLLGASVVSGGYKMVAQNNFEKAESVFLGVKQNDMNEEFMPSARSMVFTKSIWKKVGGFPEDLNDTAEDTVFNLNLSKAGAKFVTAKNAIVEWEMPATIKEFAKKIKNYAKGDAQSGIWWHPVKKWRTHNIKVLTIFGRYIVAIATIAKLLNYSVALGYMTAVVLIGIYSLWAYKKAGFWGILLQLTSDFACIIGFSHGILQAGTKRY